LLFAAAASKLVRATFRPRLECPSFPESAAFPHEGRSMRWTTRIAIIIAVLWAAYFVWPYLAVRSMVQAVRTHDIAALNQHINYPALRHSLTDQVFRAYLRLTGREARLGPFRELAIAASSSIADPIVARLISTDVMTDLLSSGWPSAVLPDRMPAMRGLRSGSLGTVWQVLANSDHGLRTFSLSVPANVPPAFQFRLYFRLTRGTWKLAGLELPEGLLVKLTQELIRVVDKK
jgi:hypothetical protein